MPSSRDENVARIALEKGYATPEQVKECLQEPSSAGETLRPLEAVLRSKGYISEDAYRQLARSAPRPSPQPLDAEVEEAAADPRKRLGKYLLLGQIGEGGMGVVFKAWQTDLRRLVALKFIRGLGSERDHERFLREAQVSATFNHPNIAAIYETGACDGKHYFAMQYVDGRTLDQIVQASPPPPLRDLVKVLAEAAEAVEYAHEHGVVHRDLKPQNVMVDARGRAFVMDFGLAKSVRVGSSVTGSGFAVGTPHYMPPEQARGQTSRIGPRSDVYGLGGILYAIATGRPPFTGEDVVSVLRKVVDSDPVPPRSLNPRLATDLETIALKAFFGRAKLRHAAGRRREAIADADAAVALDPRFAAALGLRGVMKLEEKRFKEAEQDLRRAIELEPSFKRAFQPYLDRAAGEE